MSFVEEYKVMDETLTRCITKLLVSPDACSWLLVAHLVYTPAFSN